MAGYPGSPPLAGTGAPPRVATERRVPALLALAGAGGAIAALFLPWWVLGGRTAGAFDAALHPVAAAAVGLAVLAALDAVLAAFVARGGPGRAAGRTALAAAALVVLGALALQDWGGAARGIGIFLALGGGTVVVVGCAFSPGRTARPAPQPVAAPAPAFAPQPVAQPAPAAPAPVVPAPVALPAAPPAVAFRFYVETPVPMQDVADTTRAVAVLQPRTWYVAHFERDGWLATEDGAGTRGWVLASSVRRG